METSKSFSFFSTSDKKKPILFITKEKRSQNPSKYLSQADGFYIEGDSGKYKVTLANNELNAMEF